MAYSEKLAPLVAKLPGELDAALITSDVNRQYYTGFSSSAGTVLATRGESYLIIDSRYFEAASAAVKNCKVILQDKLYQQIDGLLKKHNVTKLAVESETMTMSAYAALKDKLAGFEIPLDNRLSDLINAQRRVKTPEEMRCIDEAQKLTDDTFHYVTGIIKPGMTEKEIALDMEMYSRRKGSEEAAFSFIVAGGANSSMPHAVPGDYVVKSGDFIVMDYGCTIGGYRSDMTRTVCVGKASDKQREVYGTVLRAQLEAIAVVKAGMRCVDVDSVARNLIDATAYKGLFGHGLGHSLGLEIHEPPAFNPTCEVVLEEGVVMSVEPGIYIPGEFGVRIEDIVAVTKEGCRIFTGSPKELIEL